MLVALQRLRHLVLSHALVVTCIGEALFGELVIHTIVTPLLAKSIQLRMCVIIELYSSNVEVSSSAANVY